MTTIALLASSALRSTALGLVVGCVLAALRVRRPDIRMATWSVVLSVAVLTPLLTPWMRVSVPLPEPPSTIVSIDAHSPTDPEPALVSPQLHAQSSHATPVKPRFLKANLWSWATLLYALGVGVMLVRIAVGLIITLLLVRDSEIEKFQLLDGRKVRESSVLKSPATFGSTIFLPAEHRTWSEDKRRAVLLHEGSHVANRDFYVLMIASLYRAVFWFNPFAWWLESRLTNLAEMIADDAAARGLGDRGRYAEILTDLARFPHRLGAGLAMAAPGVVEWRIQRQLATGLQPIDARRGARLAITSVVFPLAILSAITLTRTGISKSEFHAKAIFSDDAERARAIKLAAGRRAATAPDRFLSQMPLPHGEVALREELLSLCCGTRPYLHLGTPLLSRLSGPNSGLRAALMGFGPPKRVVFMGVGPGAYDIYDVQFEHGYASVRIDMAPDGTLEDLSLDPNGDESPGRLASCSEETSLVQPREKVASNLTFLNRSGGAINLVDLGEVGHREHQVTLPDGGKTSMWRAVEKPLLVSDSAGRCMGIILPGTTTRENYIGPGGVLNVVRQSAFPGGADLLKQYLEGVRRGIVAYDRMTPEATATLQSQQEHRRAILEKLGALEDLRFEGVSRLDDDIYRARFTNGSAEWRIAFGNEGRILGIVLGPIPSSSPRQIATK